MKKFFSLCALGICILVQCGLVWGQDDALDVLYLDGKSGFVLLPSQVIEGLDQATIEAWVWWESFPKWARVFDFGVEGNAALVQNEKTSSTLNFSIYDRKSKRYRIQKSKAVTKGEWYHITAVCGREAMFFFVQGKPVGSQAYKGGLKEVSGGNNYIGKSNWESDRLFHGYITEFRIWDKARTRKQIQETMYTQLSGKEEHLIAYWRFDKMRGSLVNDLSGKEYHAVVSGKAAIVRRKGPPLKKKRALVDIRTIPGMGAYRAMVLDAYQDGKINSSERQVLDSAQQSKNLPRDVVLQVEMDILNALFTGPVNENEEIFASIVEKAYKDDVLSEGERAVLEATKFRLGISDERVKILMGAYLLSK